MKLITDILLFFSLIKTVSYGIYCTEENKVGAVSVFFLSFILGGIIIYRILL